MAFGRVKKNVMQNMIMIMQDQKKQKINERCISLTGKDDNKLSKAKQLIKTFFEIIEDTVLNQPDVDLNHHYVKGVKDTIKWAKAYYESMNVKYIDVEVEDDQFFIYVIFTNNK